MAPKFDYSNSQSCIILNIPPSLQVLSGARENALAESESILQSSRGAGSIWKCLEVQVRATRVSGRLEYSFQTELHFTDGIYGTPYMDTHLADKPISNEYFHIFDDEHDLWSPMSCEEEYRLARWCIKYNLSTVAMNDLIRNPTMATVSNITLPNTVFKQLNKMSYAMGINS